MGSRKIDWDKVETVIEPACDPNPNNPYAELDPAHRDRVLRQIARSVLLRKVNDASASN